MNILDQILNKVVYVSDILVLCDNWEDSKGCNLEYLYAKDNNKIVLHLRDIMSALNNVV